MGYRSYNEVHRASGYVGLEIGGLGIGTCSRERVLAPLAIQEHLPELSPVCSSLFPHLVNLFGNLIVPLLVSFANSPEDSFQLGFFGFGQSLESGAACSSLRFAEITKPFGPPRPTHRHTHTHTRHTAIPSQGSRVLLPRGAGVVGLASTSEASSSVSSADFSGSGLASWYIWDDRFRAVAVASYCLGSATV